MDYLLLKRQSRSLIESSLALLSHNSKGMHQTFLQMETSLRALETSVDHLAAVERHQNSGGKPF